MTNAIGDAEALINQFLGAESQKPVPNRFPTATAPYRIALIGEAPGENEEKAGIPFVGYAGELLNGVLADADIRREACFVGNVCQIRPPGNKIKLFSWNGHEIQSGLGQLKLDLDRFNPHICVLMGNTALQAAKSTHPSTAKAEFPVSSWRGSLFVCDIPSSPFFNRKCMATYHPAAILRVYEDILLVRYDMRRARREATTPYLQLPVRNINISPTLDYITTRLQAIRDTRQMIALDIEGYVGDIKCVSIATSPWDVFIVPFTRMNGDSYWDEESEAVIWAKLGGMLSDPAVPKVLQNVMYDQFVFAYSYGILIRGVVDDTMLKHWEQFNEMEKALDVQTSIYTREPFYKMGRKSRSLEEFFTYCCKDSAVTYEINTVLDKTMATWPPEVQGHYRFNVRLLRPMMYMQLRGIRFDVEKRDRRVAELEAKAVSLQAQLNSAAGTEVNVRSPKKMKEFLYEHLKLPKQYKRGELDDEGNRKETADFEALLKLAKHKTGPETSRMLMMCIRLRETLKRRSDLASIGVDPGGRVRFSYIIPGSQTGRLACRESATGSGTNGQTIRKDIVEDGKSIPADRDLFTRDSEEYDIAEQDLSGADGWTVAAHCAALGDTTMLEDLLYGLKIPMLIGLGVKHGPAVNALDRATLKSMQKEIVKGSPFHFSLKQVQHGSNYGMKPPTVALRIFIESYGDIEITDQDAAKYQGAYLRRYPGVLRWHEWVRQQIKKGYLQTASGSRRIISGRKNDETTLKAVLAHEPQANTTYVTNLAAHRCYYDPQNWQGNRLIVEPIHQIHDALLDQWKQSERDFAFAKLREWFNIELIIAGIKIRIPFEGAYGTSWGDLPNPI